MKKVLFTIAAAVMMLAATSCKKENVNEPENFDREPEAYEFLATVGGGMQQNAPAVNDGMGTMATFDGLKVMWQIGDVIYVNGKGNSFTCTTDPAGTNRAYFENTNQFPDGFQATQYHAFYSTTISAMSLAEEGDPTKGVTGTLSATQTYNPEKKAENLPMYATSTDHWLNFNNICAAIKIIVPLSSANTIEGSVADDEQLYGNFNMSGSVATFDPETTSHNVITVKKVENKNFQNGDEVYIAIPAGTYHNLNISFKNGNNLEWETGASEKEGGLTVVANKIYNINLTGAFKGLLPGRFKVSGSKFVQFTTGNLYYNRNNGNGAYALEASQNDYPTSFSADHVSHFFFCESVTDAAADAYNVSMGNSHLFCDENNKITVNEIAGLYCLSKNEWKYVSDNHTKISKYDCLIIAPYDYGVTSIPDLGSIAAYTAAGYLCLPKKASYRTETTVVQNDDSRYWTSTAISGGTDAHGFELTANDKINPTSRSKDKGRNIRLAKTL